MTRYVFEKVNPFKEWMADHVTSEKYEAYITPSNEVVLVPLKSTHPLKYGYARLIPDNIKEIHQWLKEKGVKTYSADVDWDDTKPPGVEYIPQK